MTTIVQPGVPVYVGGTIPKFDGVKDTGMVDGEFLDDSKQLAEPQRVYKGGTVSKKILESEPSVDEFGRELFR